MPRPRTMSRHAYNARFGGMNNHPFHVWMRRVYIPVHVIALILAVVMYAMGAGA